MKRLSALLLILAFLTLLLPPSQAAEEVKVAAFTFDDGPSKTITPALLDALAERGVRVTFFVNGKNAERYPDIVLRAAAEGHQIANHTYSHSQLTKLSNESVLSEVSRTQEYLSELLGEKEYLVRVPYGAISERVQGLINVPLIMWSVDPTSGRVMSSDAMRDGIVRTAHDGAIILMHDTSRSNLTASIEAIDLLLDEGYVFVTVDELFEIKGTVPAGGTLYYKLTGDNVGAFFDEKHLDTHWAYDAIRTVQDAGIMQGDARGFRPDWGMTRAEAVTVLYRLAGAPEGYPAAAFCDVQAEDWYAAAVAWAVSEGVTAGISETRFGADGYVTKEQFYTLFERYMETTDTIFEENAAVDAQPGDETVSAWAYPAVQRLRACGFCSAGQSERFAPRAFLTRAEAAELVTWFLTAGSETL